MEHSILAGQLRCICLGEGDSDVALLAHADAGYLLFKTGNEHTAAQHQRILLGLAAFKGDTVHKALKVQRDLVAHSGAVHLFFQRVGAAVVRERLIHIVIGQFGILPVGAQALILAQLHLGVQIHDGGEGIAIGTDLLHVQLGGTGDEDILTGDGIHQRLRIGGVDRLLIQCIGAVSGLQRLAGRSAGRIALHREVGLGGGIYIVQRLLPRTAIHGDGQFDAAVFQIFSMYNAHIGSPFFAVATSII